MFEQELLVEKVKGTKDFNTIIPAAKTLDKNMQFNIEFECIDSFDQCDTIYCDTHLDFDTIDELNIYDCPETPKGIRSYVVTRGSSGTTVSLEL